MALFDFNSLEKKPPYTLEAAEQYFEEMYDRERINDIFKIKLKCWIAYCRYAKREENAKEAMKYYVYTNAVCADTYIGHIESGEIDSSDLGGKEAAINTVKIWYGIKKEEDL